MKTTSSCPSCGEGGLLTQARDNWRNAQSNIYLKTAKIVLICKHCDAIVWAEPVIKVEFDFELIET